MLGLGRTEEQAHLRKVLQSLLSRRSGEDRVREVMASEDGHDRDLWDALASELGCHGLAVSESQGGAGATLLEQGVVLEELGRSLACVPYFATVCLALPLLQRFSDQPQAAAAIRAIAEGKLVATLAMCEPGGSWDDDALGRLDAQQDGERWVLRGVKTFVPDGHLADLVLVTANLDGDLALFAVPGDSEGLERTQLPTMDQTRRQAQLSFAGVEATLLGAAVNEEVQVALAQSTALLAMEQVGAASRVLDGTCEYAKLRTQFNVPIGSFQAVKHKLADMLKDVEAARSAAYYAVAAAAEESADLAAAASLSKAFCSDALVRVTNESVQVHGAIGLTWEHWVHLYLKRARSSAVLLGTAPFHRERLAVAIGI